MAEIRILETWNTDDISRLEYWLPVDSVSPADQGTVTVRFIAGPANLLPISERSGGGFSRQVVSVGTTVVDLKDAIIDYIVANVDVDEAGVLTVLGKPNRAAVKAYDALQTFGLLDTGTQQLYVSRGIVEASWEKDNPAAANRKNLDRAALAVTEKAASIASIKAKYGTTPAANGLTWFEFAAAFHVNLEDVPGKDSAVEAAKQYIDTYF